MKTTIKIIVFAFFFVISIGGGAISGPPPDAIRKQITENQVEAKYGAEIIQEWKSRNPERYRSETAIINSLGHLLTHNLPYRTRK